MTDASHRHDAQSGIVDRLPTETEGLSEATRPEVVALSDGDSFDVDPP